uniref:Deoxyribonuclease-2-alpha n=1 Tax=Lepisosteus oculatus TaxID=7918 RepID=W5MNY9_LEPOC|nr:PREDICTED: deoxyribonuclease-2-alpha-like [Lepisosteus oculatus]
MDAVWMLLIWPVMIFVHSGLTAGAAVSCRNEQGESVDWFILYKLPDHDEGRGLRYLYMDDHTNGWVYGKKLVNDSKSAVGQTLQPFLSYIHKKTVDFGYLLYNDQPPKSFKPAPSSFGHSKGK